MTKVEEEILQVISGQFHAAAVGPEAVSALQEKIQKRPGHYLNALRRMTMGDAFDPKVHADLHISALLGILHAARPDDVTTIIQSLLRLYDGVLVSFDAVQDRGQLDGIMDEATINLLYRLNTRRLELRALLNKMTADGGDGPQ